MSAPQGPPQHGYPHAPPPHAPHPHAPPPHAPPQHGPNSVPGGEHTDKEERMVAACSYLTWLAGFWIIGPILLYLIYRDKSRYVAFHCIQSIVLSVGLTVLAPILWVMGLVIMFLVSMALGPKSMPAFMFIGYWGVFAVALLVPLVWMLWGAWRAFEGHRWKVPLAWRIARRFTEDDGRQPFQSTFQPPGAPR